ncbi:(2Fe-2S)-binding protein [candidate division WOR-3 bacterium]|nr:(2Fe-2S)-binding protein [candidate division WOR-3 bacterium]
MKGYIEQHPVLEFKRGEVVTFTFEGREIQGYEGLPIAAALHAAGIKVYSYSIKHERPRGFFCAVGKCSSCLMEVDGRPNVMVCMEPLKAGMKVKRQKGPGKL